MTTSSHASFFMGMELGVDRIVIGVILDGESNGEDQSSVSCVKTSLVQKLDLIEDQQPESQKNYYGQFENFKEDSEDLDAEIKKKIVSNFFEIIWRPQKAIKTKIYKKLSIY